MGVRGQSPEAWVSRWRKGDCPIHGLGLVPVDAAVDDGDNSRASGRDNTAAVAVHCTHEECDFHANRFAGRDRYHHRFGWVAGPDNIRAALRKANAIDDDGAPSRWTADTRTSYPLQDDG
jgi:hypothetical protein